jgi:hypothetical protein
MREDTVGAPVLCRFIFITSKARQGAKSVGKDSECVSSEQKEEEKPSRNI